MPTAARVLAIDKVADRTPKKCSNCHQVKARDRFSPNLKNGDGLQAHCQDCHRIAEYVRYHDGGGKAAKAAYRARDDVKERRREYERTHKEAAHARVRAYRTSLKGRLHDGRYQARRRLAAATDEKSRARATALVAAYDRELAKFGATPELTTGPLEPRPRAAYGSKSVARGVQITKEGTFKVKVSDGKGSAVQGGTHKTLDEAKAVANALGRQVLNIDGYADAPARGKVRP
jgi:hypothetical protein